MAKKKRIKTVEADPVSIRRLVTPEARAKGIYVVDQIDDPEAPPPMAGQRAAKASAVVNKGGTTLDRWLALGSIDERQMRAIDRYRWAHAVVIGGVAGRSAWPELSGVVAHGGGMTAESRMAMEADVRDEWDTMQARVFRGLHSWYDCWQNVVLHDEPAGLAGGRLGFKGRDSAATSALCCVRFFADLIAGEFGL